MSQLVFPSVSESSHLFLSDDWIEAARALRAEFADRIEQSLNDLERPEGDVDFKMNVVVTEIPHREADLEGNIDSSDGDLVIDKGHLDEPDLTVTIDYQTAKAAFVTRDQQAIMQSFFAGKILVEGDVSRLLLIQSQSPGPELVELYQRLSDLTAEDT